MKKLILGVTLMLCGAIGFAGTAIACAAMHVRGAFDSILTIIHYSGMAPYVISILLFLCGLPLFVYAITKDEKELTVFYD